MLRDLGRAHGYTLQPGRAGVAELAELMDAMAEEHTRDDAEAQNETVALMGFFLGESVIAEAGGAWAEADGALGVKLPSGGFAAPFAAVARHFAGGERIDAAFDALVTA